MINLINLRRIVLSAGLGFLVILGMCKSQPLAAQELNVGSSSEIQFASSGAVEQGQKRASVLTVFGNPAMGSYLRDVLTNKGLDSDEVLPDLYPGQQVQLKSGLIIQNVAYPNLKTELLAFSDHPERVKERGLLFKGGLIPFKTLRFQYYHEGGKEDNNLWLRLDLRNNSSRKKAAIMLIEGEGGPDADYFQAGHKNNVEFLQRLATGCGRLLLLEPGQSAAIFCKKLPYCQVLSGTTQFTLLEGSEVSFNLVALEDPQEMASFNLLSNPKDVHARGIYACADQFINKVIKVGNNSQSEVFAAVGAVRQPNIALGPELKGDYGVVYALQFLLINETEQNANFDLIVNPRGGKATATILKQTDFYAGIVDSSAWLSDQAPDLELFRFGPQYNDCSLSKEIEPFTEYKASTITLPAKQSAVVRLLTIPEGASNYPVRLIMRQVSQNS